MQPNQILISEQKYKNNLKNHESQKKKKKKKSHIYNVCVRPCQMISCLALPASMQKK